MGLSAIRTTAAGNGLDDLDLFAGTGVLDKVPEVDGAIVAGVVTLILVVVILILSGWVRGMRGRLIHVNTSSVLAAPPGSLDPPAGASYVVNIRIISGLY